jgi:hypothetical protein
MTIAKFKPKLKVQVFLQGKRTFERHSFSLSAAHHQRCIYKIFIIKLNSYNNKWVVTQAAELSGKICFW